MPQDFSTSNEMRASKTSVTVIVMEFKDSCDNDEYIKSEVRIKGVF